MTKKILFSLALVAALIAILSLSAMAQNTQTKPGVSVRENVLAPGTPPILKHPWLPNTALPPAPLYCSGNGGKCLFYGGDFNADNLQANALPNETDIVVAAGGSTPNYGAAVFGNFEVTAGQTWSVTGLFSNVLSTASGVSPKQAYWEIRSGLSMGNAGSLVAFGTAADSYTPTGRSGMGLTEYTVKVFITPSVVLTSGTYFMAVIPQCYTNNVNCTTARYFLSDCEDRPPANKVGYQQSNDAFLNSGFFGANYEPTWGTTGACAGKGCNRFSFGVIGTK